MAMRSPAFLEGGGEQCFDEGGDFIAEFRVERRLDGGGSIFSSGGNEG